MNSTLVDSVAACVNELQATADWLSERAAALERIVGGMPGKTRPTSENGERRAAVLREAVYLRGRAALLRHVAEQYRRKTTTPEAAAEQAAAARNVMDGLAGVLKGGAS